MESSLEKEYVEYHFVDSTVPTNSFFRCRDTRTKIAQLTETDYAVAKADVDRLRKELGQPPLPSLQHTLEEKTSQFVYAAPHSFSRFWPDQPSPGTSTSVA